MSDCICYPVEDKYLTKHYGAVEPGSAWEPNPDCPVHFPEPATRHAAAIEAAKTASDALLASSLTPEQRQLVVDMMNAAQDLNTLYWDARREEPTP